MLHLLNVLWTAMMKLLPHSFCAYVNVGGGLELQQRASDPLYVDCELLWFLSASPLQEYHLQLSVENYTVASYDSTTLKLRVKNQ